uniref:Uncharacterized protein n=1 Tax=Anopheles darlingi TaxID=43151 RepID=A0A2M4D711_ANODA
MLSAFRAALFGCSFSLVASALFVYYGLRWQPRGGLYPIQITHYFDTLALLPFFEAVFWVGFFGARDTKTTNDEKTK